MEALLQWCIMSRDKEPKPPSTNVVTKTEVLDTCSGCYRFLEKEEVNKKAKAKHRLFSFCNEDCYHEWLRNPSTMFL